MKKKPILLVAALIVTALIFSQLVSNDSLPEPGVLLPVSLGLIAALAIVLILIKNRKSAVESGEDTLYHNYIKPILSYLLAVLLAFLYMLYLDEDSGMIILAAAVFLPLMSFLSALYLHSTLVVETSLSDTIIHKGDSLSLIVTLTKTTFLPTPFINIDLIAPNAFEQEKVTTLRTAMGFSKKQCIEQEYASVLCGSCPVGIKSIEIIDYIGLLHLKLSPKERIVANAEIIPAIVNVSPKAELMNMLSSASIMSDDDENTRPTYVRGAFPGYEHREYVGGDPIKRINWKLSSKRGTLMVRLDELPSNIKPLFMLDVSRTATKSTASDYDFCKAVYEDYTRLVESLLGILLLLLHQGIQCRIACPALTSDSIFIIDSAEALNKLAVEFSTINPTTVNDVFSMSSPLIQSQKGESCVALFSAQLAGDSVDYINSVSSDGGTAICVAPSLLDKMSAINGKCFIIEANLELRGLL